VALPLPRLEWAVAEEALYLYTCTKNKLAFGPVSDAFTAEGTPFQVRLWGEEVANGAHFPESRTVRQRFA
jgi:hypothetical protein